MINNEQGKAYSHYPYFNPEFVKDKQLQRLEGKYVIIAPGHSLKQTEYVKGFEFDKEGRVTREYENYPGDGSTDTSEVLYSYNVEGDVSRICVRQQNGYRIHEYRYDSVGRVCDEGYAFAKTADADILNFEKCSYVEIENQERRKRYNSDGIAYKEEWYYYENNRLIKIKDRFKMSASNLETTFSYDESGLLVEKMQKRVKSDEILQHVKFTYEDKNLSSLQRLSGDEISLDVQFIYNEQGILASIIEEDSETNAMRIVRFKKIEKY